MTTSRPACFNLARLAQAQIRDNSHAGNMAPGAHGSATPFAFFPTGAELLSSPSHACNGNGVSNVTAAKSRDGGLATVRDLASPFPEHTETLGIPLYYVIPANKSKPCRELRRFPQASS